MQCNDEFPSGVVMRDSTHRLGMGGASSGGGGSSSSPTFSRRMGSRAGSSSSPAFSTKQGLPNQQEDGLRGGVQLLPHGLQQAGLAEPVEEGEGQSMVLSMCDNSNINCQERVKCNMKQFHTVAAIQPTLLWSTLYSLIEPLLPAVDQLRAVLTLRGERCTIKERLGMRTCTTD